MSDTDGAGHARGLAMAERIREALEDAFEAEVREVLRRGDEAPLDRLHDYLTGVDSREEPRVRLLFELLDDGTLDLTGDLADVPASCFFLGETVRYQRSLADWTDLLGPVRPYEVRPDDPDHLLLWGAGDLLWRADRGRAQAARDYLTLLLDEPVGLWCARVRPEHLLVLATDPWSARDERRVAVPADLLDLQQVEEGILPPSDVPLAPRPRLVDAPPSSPGR